MIQLRLFAVRYFRWLMTGAWTLILFGLFSHSRSLSALGAVFGLLVLTLMDHATLVRLDSPYLQPEWQRVFKRIRVMSFLLLAMVGFIAVMDYLQAWP